MATVTVVIPTYNSENYIEKTLNSVIKQSRLPDEIIIVDDCSIDKTISIINNIIKANINIKILLIEQSQNKGVSYARNIGIINSDSDYIAFLDSDDQWTSDKIELQMKFVEDNNINFSYTSYLRINNKDKILNLVNSPIKVNYKKMLFTNYIGCSTVIIKKENCLDGFPDIRIAQDYAFWLKILDKEVDYAYGLNKPLTRYLVRNDSISGKKLKIVINVYYMFRMMKFSKYKSGFYFGTHILISIYNRLIGLFCNR